jgi:hypothetical protein
LPSITLDEERKRLSEIQRTIFGNARLSKQDENDARNHQIRLEPRVSRREAAVQSAFVKMVSWFRAELDCS